MRLFVGTKRDFKSKIGFSCNDAPNTLKEDTFYIA